MVDYMLTVAVSGGPSSADAIASPSAPPFNLEISMILVLVFDGYDSLPREYVAIAKSSMIPVLSFIV